MAESKYTPMVVAAGRALCKNASEVCNVDFEDNWKVYSEGYMVDAQRVLAACGVPTLLGALFEAIGFVEDHEDVRDGPSGEPQPNRAMQLAQTLRAAIALATEPRQ